MSSASSAISSLDSTISSFKSQVDVKVTMVDVSTTNIQATTDKIYEKINKFRTDMLHGEAVQIANENILRIDQIIKEQFSNYVVIRRTIIGIVRDFDINLVRNSTIQELSEELWITSSRYWLSYALIAITAWVNNYPEVAKNALAESVRKDAIKTTLFFCLINLRFSRNEAAKLWFYEYFRALDPTKLQQETAVLLQSYLNGVFGKDKALENEVNELIKEWVRLLSNDEKISNELLDAYEVFIRNFTVQAKFEYPALSQYCTNCDDLRKSYMEVSKYIPLLKFVKALDVEMEEQNETNYKSRIDVILTNLITNYDKEELELKKQQEYHRLIIENNGIVEQAETQFEAQEALQNENYNIGKQMIKWVIYDHDEQTNVQVRKFSFQKTKSWFKNAVNKWSTKINEQFLLEYDLKIDLWSGTSNGNDQQEQITSLRNHYEINKFTYIYVNNYNIAALMVLIVSFGLVFLTLYALIATFLALGFLVYRIYKGYKGFPERINKAVDNLKACMAELAEFRSYFEINKSIKEDLISFVEFI